MRESARAKRREDLAQCLQENPFLTDEELSRILGVSIQTVRLDRMALGIPELRERVKNVAREAYQKVRSILASEIVGELLDLELGKTGVSVLDITAEMALSRTGIARGHYLFAQANSLAVAVIDADTVLTGSARVRYKRPVYVTERVIAYATVKVKKGATYLVSVHSRVKAETVFKGQFIVQALKCG